MWEWGCERRRSGRRSFLVLELDGVAAAAAAAVGVAAVEFVECNNSELAAMDENTSLDWECTVENTAVVEKASD